MPTIIEHCKTCDQLLVKSGYESESSVNSPIVDASVAEP